MRKFETQIQELKFKVLTEIAKNLEKQAIKNLYYVEDFFSLGARDRNRTGTDYTSARF